MTYGPPPGGWNAGDPQQPYQGGYQGAYPQQPQPDYGPPQPGFGQPPSAAYGHPTGAPAPGGSALSTRLLRGPDGRRVPLTILAAVQAFMGVLMVVFSCLTWASASQDSATVTVNGLGRVSASSEFGSHSGNDASTYPAGIWTIVFGILLIIAATPVLVRLGVAAGAIVGVLAGFAGLVAAGVFLADPIGSLATEDVPDETKHVYGAGYGLILVFIAVLVGFLVAIAALVLTLLPDKAPRPPQFGAGTPTAGFGQQQQFGAYPQQQPDQFGGYQQPGGYPQQPGQPGGYPQQPGGYPQQGYPLQY